MVISPIRIVKEETLEEIGIIKRNVTGKRDNLFLDLINEKNVIFPPGGYMIRTKDFLTVIPEREIYESKAGQNWQILLPMSYKYKYGYLQESLYDYVVRGNSHSRKDISKESLMRKTYDHEDLLTNTINRMNIKNKQLYLNIIKKKYIIKRLYISLQFNDRTIGEQQYNILKEKKWLNLKTTLIFLRLNNSYLNNLYIKIKKVI